MSTVSITPAPALSLRRPQTRLRLTARGRRLLASLAALPLAAGIALAAANGVSAIASSEAVESASFATVTVMPGDTLWSLATEIAPAADPREVVDAIVRLNILSDGGAIYAGQQLAVPAEYAPVE